MSSSSSVAASAKEVESGRGEKDFSLLIERHKALKLCRKMWPFNQLNPPSLSLSYPFFTERLSLSAILSRDDKTLTTMVVRR